MKRSERRRRFNHTVSTFKKNPQFQITLGCIWQKSVHFVTSSAALPLASLRSPLPGEGRKEEPREKKLTPTRPRAPRRRVIRFEAPSLQSPPRRPPRQNPSEAAGIWLDSGSRSRARSQPIGRSSSLPPDLSAARSIRWWEAGEGRGGEGGRAG